MNCDRTPGTVLMPRNTDPLELSAARRVLLKLISLKGPFPRTVGRRMFDSTQLKGAQTQHLQPLVHRTRSYLCCRIHNRMLEKEEESRIN